jgi:hypothetical protein
MTSPGTWGGYSWGTTTWAGPFSTPIYFSSLEHDIVVTDSFEVRNAISLIELDDDVAVSDTFQVRGQHYPVDLEDDIIVTDKFNSVHVNHIAHDVNYFHQYVYEHIVVRTLADILDVSTDFDRNMLFTINTTPDLISIFNRNVIYIRTLTNSETITSQLDPLLFTTNPTHPIASGVEIVYSGFVILKTDIGSIVLPVPELNDSIKNVDEVTLRRAMSGFLFSYIKKGKSQSFTYTWLLDFIKASELKAWLRLNMSRKVIVTNWKGEIWSCDITSDLASFRAETKYQGTARQKTSITVEFEGVKLHG